jgi:hypothetical protein
MQSGTIATYGDTFRWAISYVGSKYVIESVDNPGKFLAASATSGNTSMEVVTATASSVPTRAQWTISNASGGGVLTHTKRFQQRLSDQHRNRTEDYYIPWYARFNTISAQRLAHSADCRIS